MSDPAILWANPSSPLATTSPPIIVTKPPPLKQNFPDNFILTMTTAIATTSALTWTDAFRSLFAEKGLFEQWKHVGPWIVAVLVTITAVLATYGLNTLRYRVATKTAAA